MNRRDFTKKISTLILEMIADGNYPVIDYALRSREEQKRLYDLGASKCDGEVKISAHQKGMAMDIYFVVTREDGTVHIDYDYKETSDLAVKYHARLVQMGGEPMIDWDKCHYEGR